MTNQERLVKIKEAAYQAKRALEQGEAFARSFKLLPRGAESPRRAILEETVKVLNETLAKGTSIMPLWTESIMTTWGHAHGTEGYAEQVHMTHQFSSVMGLYMDRLNDLLALVRSMQYAVEQFKVQGKQEAPAEVSILEAMKCCADEEVFVP